MSTNSSTDPTLTDQTAANSASHRTRNIVLIVIAAIVVVVLVGGGIWWGVSSSNNAAPKTKLTVALQLFPTNLDIRNTAGAALDQTLVNNVYQGLVSRDAAGKISPSLAKSWKISSDARTYTFTLNSGEKFSNGHALTSADVAYSINDVIKNKRQDFASFARVDSVKSKGSDTVVISLSKPDPTLLYNLAGREGIVIDPKAKNSINTTAVASGPYLVSSFKAGSTLTLTRNPNYWGDKAQIGTVVFKLFSDTNAIVNAILAGSVDIAGVDPNLLAKVKNDKSYTVKTGFASDKFVLAFNNKVAPFTDKRVREAIRYGIDHPAIVKAVGGGNTLYGPIVASDPGYQDLSSLYPYDPTKAKKLLADAGYPDGLNLTVTIASFYGTTVTDLLTSQLAKAGIHLTVKSVDFPTWLSSVYTNHDYQLSIVDHAEARDFYNWANPGYYFGYDNKKVQALYNEATSATSAAQYSSLLAQAAKIVSQDAAADWLYNPTEFVALRKGLTGVSIDSWSSNLDLTHAKLSK
jgi:peptide/nickel transport system substrate-binding protein